ncbi:MAG: hypothetical protein MJZ99_05155 [Bacteroidales bacterium]|nr:hypothetical protein [Bacteroidales bacterium]
MGYVVVLTQPTCTAPQAVVNAVAIPGYRFDHWSNGSTANPYSFNLSQNTSLVAYFAEAVRDTVFIHDTTFVDNYIHDTTIVNNYIHDTTFVDNYIHDTTIVNNYVHDTTFIDVFIHDTTVLTEWIYDTTYVDLWHYDTIVVQQELTYYNISVLSENNARGLVAGNGRFPDGTEIEIAAIPIEGSQFLQWDDGNSDNPRTVTVSSDLTFVATFDAATQSVIDVEAVKHTVNVSGLQIIVNNAAGNQIRIFDEIGRCLSTTNSLEQVRVFNMPASGVYMVQVGSYPAQKVVVVR